MVDLTLGMWLHQRGYMVDPTIAKKYDVPIEHSKVFFVDPKTLPLPIFRYLPPSPTYSSTRFTDLRNSILKNGFDSNRPIVVRIDKEDRRKMKNQECRDMEYKRIWKKDDRPSCIFDGNHRLAIALELKLEKIPVQFVLN